MINMRGVFITFEGGEGTGKTTQINLLHDYLISMNLDVLITKEPGGCPIGQKIKSIILSKEKEQEKPATMAEMFLYLADRAQHVASVIRPALNAHKIVICDRYTDSTLAYQGYGRKLKIEELEALNRLATENLEPDITFLLDIDPVIGRKRIRHRADGLDRMELEALKFHRLIRLGFLALAERFPERIKIIDASMTIEEIHNIIKEFLFSMPFFSPKQEAENCHSPNTFF